MKWLQRMRIVRNPTTADEKTVAEWFRRVKKLALCCKFGENSEIQRQTRNGLT